MLKRLVSSHSPSVCSPKAAYSAKEVVDAFRHRFAYPFSGEYGDSVFGTNRKYAHFVAPFYPGERPAMPVGRLAQRQLAGVAAIHGSGLQRSQAKPTAHLSPEVIYDGLSAVSR